MDCAYCGGYGFNLILRSKAMAKIYSRSLGMDLRVPINWEENVKSKFSQDWKKESKRERKEEE